MRQAERGNCVAVRLLPSVLKLVSKETAGLAGLDCTHSPHTPEHTHRCFSFALACALTGRAKASYQAHQ
jgi:hypothetical protein